MPDKKKQHIIPQCYLAPFADATPPEGFEGDRYEPGVWITDKALSERPKRKSPKNVLWKSYFYNLEEDSPNEPVIENHLSSLESDYSGVLGKIDNCATLTIDDAVKLATFVDTLYGRTELMLSYWQSKIDEIQHLFRQVDRAHSGNEDYSDQYWEGADEGAKRMILNESHPIAYQLFIHGFWLIINETDMPFFTSDNPVSYSFMNTDDLANHSVPLEWINDQIPTSVERHFCYCPITPTRALVSSPLLGLDPKILYVSVPNRQFAIGMNFLTRSLASEIVVSSTNPAFSRHHERALRSIRLAEASFSMPKHHFRIYTAKRRCDLVVSRYERIKENPIQWSLEFWTEEIDKLHTIKDDGEITLVEIYDSGEERGGQRNMRFRTIADNPDEPSVLEQLL